MSSSYEIRKGIINESALIGVKPPLEREQLALVSLALKKLVNAEITYGDISAGYTPDGRIYTEVHISTESRPNTYIDDAAQAVGNALNEQGAQVSIVQETARFVGRSGLLFTN
jgi:hypothetical protein